MEEVTLERSSKEEAQKIEKEVWNKLANHTNRSGYTYRGPYANDEAFMSVNTTTDIIKNFRTLGLNSYRKGQFDEFIPEPMRYFVDRANTLAPGMEEEYHEARIHYIRSMLDSVKSDPKMLRSLESVVYYFFLKNIITEKTDNQRFTNAILHFRQLEDNVCEIYSLYCLEEFGRPHFVIGVEDDGTVHTRRYAREGDKAELDIYNKIHPHALVFMNLDPAVSGRIIFNGARWARDENRLKTLARENAGFAGFELLSSGIENKHFHNSEPHEIIIGNSNIKSMVVVDSPPDSAGFCTKFKDDTISVGFMSVDKNKGVRAYNSDLTSTLVINDIMNLPASNFLFDLAGAIARDMFVCIEREKYYRQENSLGERRGQKKGKQNKVIWLPRFKINLRAKESYSQIMEKAISLSPCHVSGHPRRCDNPSLQQLEIAKSLGIKLPFGYTYVQEHDRGPTEQRRLYKSRSAMNVLFEGR